MINQRLYPDIKLGNGLVSIATDGCYLACLAWGLQLQGYSYTLPQLNQLFKDKGVFGAGSSLLSAATISARLPNIFVEGRNEIWNDARLIWYLANPAYFVIGEVSGKGIGGSGQHFVKIRSVVTTVRNTIAQTFIDDPWDGLNNQKVTTRFNEYGNILSFRVFKIAPLVVAPVMISVKKSDWERLLKASGSGDTLVKGMGLDKNIADATSTELQGLLTEHVGLHSTIASIKKLVD